MTSATMPVIFAHRSSTFADTGRKYILPLKNPGNKKSR
jgi:hypothetical protein